ANPDPIEAREAEGDRLDRTTATGRLPAAKTSRLGPYWQRRTARSGGRMRPRLPRCPRCRPADPGPNPLALLGNPPLIPACVARTWVGRVLLSENAQHSPIRRAAKDSYQRPVRRPPSASDLPPPELSWTGVPGCCLAGLFTPPASRG